MADLSLNAMAAWLDRLPDDIRSAVGDVAAGDDDRLAELSAVLSAAPADRLSVIVSERADDFMAMGRARRLRFLAWVARRTYPESGLLFRALAEDDDEGGQSGGRSKIAPYFLEDVKALVNVLGPRVAMQVVNGDNLGAVVRSSYELQSESEFRQGGAL